MALGNVNKPKKSIFSEWLEQLQQESWQLELLISGLALFGIWESRGLLQHLEYYIDVNVTDQYRFYTRGLLLAFWGGWTIFMSNLLIHIIIRGLWIGAIGLRYVSGDIDFEELNYSDIFTNYFKKRIGGFDEYIERLEKLSSVIFSFTFLLFLILFSFIFLNLVFGVMFTLLNNAIKDPTTNEPSGYAIIFGAFFYVVGLLVLIDFVTLGAFKKVKDKTFSRIYFGIYRFYSFISLSSIYRPLLLNFIDDRYTRRLLLFAIPYTFIILVGFSSVHFERYSFMPSFSSDHTYARYINQHSINWHNYDDEREAHYETFSTDNKRAKKERIRSCSINSYEQDGDYAKLFLVYGMEDSEMLRRKHKDFTEFRKNGLRHRLFSKGVLKDEKAKQLETDEAAEIRIMSRLVRGELDKITAEDSIQYASWIETYRNYTADDRDNLISEIRSDYSSQQQSLFKQKLEDSKKMIKDIYTVSLNDTLYNDSLSCSFYIHPNMHEKGLLCYMPLSQVNKGEHMITVRKRYNSRKCVDDCPSIWRYIPFRKTN